MYHHVYSRRDDDDDYNGYDDGNRRKKQARPPARQDNERGHMNRVDHATGLSVSPKHHYSIHVYLIFHRFDNMEPGTFVARLSFRTMFNDLGGTKTVDFSPAAEDADPLSDKNGRNLREVMVAREESMYKIGWLKRIEEKEGVYAWMNNCLPLPKRPKDMGRKEWDERRVKGPECRMEWVLKAIRMLKEDRLWECLPEKQFQDRHKELQKAAEVPGLREWKERANWAEAALEATGDRRQHWKRMQEIGPKPMPTFDMIQASSLYKIMNNVKKILYSEHEEETKKTPKGHRSWRDRVGF